MWYQTSQYLVLFFSKYPLKDGNAPVAGELKNREPESLSDYKNVSNTIGTEIGWTSASNTSWVLILK